MRLPLCMAGIALACVASAQTTVGGQITTNTRWSVAGSPYLVTASLEVGSGAMLTIDPGVQVRFGAGLGLTVGNAGSSGALVARGTAAAPILLTRGASAGTWKGIAFTANAGDAVLDGARGWLSGSVLEHCSIEYTGAGQAAIDSYRAVPLLLATTVAYSASDGVRFVAPRGEANVRSCVVHDVAGDGVVLTFDAVQPVAYGPLRCVGNTVKNATGSGLRYDSRRYGGLPAYGFHFEANLVQGCGVGIDVVEAGSADADGALLSGEIFGCGYGVRMTCAGEAVAGLVLADVVVRGNGFGIGVSRLGYAPKQLLLLHCTVVGNPMLGVSLEPGTAGADSVVVTGCSISANGATGTLVGLGGGMNIARYDSYPSAARFVRIEDSTFADNQGTDGGGLYVTGRANLNRCTFAGNTALRGGGMQIGPGGWFNYGSPQLDSCLFLGNSGGKGDDIYVGPPSAAAFLSYCRFASPGGLNAANTIWDQADDPTLGPTSGLYPDSSPAFASLGLGVAGAAGTPILTANGTLAASMQVVYGVYGAAALAPGFVLLSSAAAYGFAFGGHVVPDLAAPSASFFVTTSANGTASLTLPNLPALPRGTRVYAQAFVLDLSAPAGFGFTNAVLGVAR